MTEQINIAITERQRDLLKVALGLLLIDWHGREDSEQTKLDGVEVTERELIDLGRSVVHATSTPAQPDALTPVEKFLLAGAIGSFLPALEERGTKEGAYTAKRIKDLGVRLGLLDNPVGGLQAFMKELER